MGVRFTLSRVIRAHIAAVVALFVAIPALAQNEELVLVGRVDRLLDGDTFDVRLDGDDDTTRIRMQGIDAPETDQPMTDEAVALLRVLLGDGEIELQPAGQTSYTRMVARIYVGETDVNAEMVRRGLAMAERRYLREFDDGADYCVFEQAARSDKLGIWRLPANQRVAPWEWRPPVNVRGRGGEFTDYSNETVEGCVAAIGKPLGSSGPALRPTPPVSPSEPFSCAVRKTCSQMQSCDEAQFYLRQCRAPIDGDDDGVPCEAICR